MSMELIAEIQRRLRAADEWRYAHGPPDHPPFKSAERAADNLLRLIIPGASILVMRDQCLAPLRVAILESGYRLVTTNSTGNRVFEIPPTALGNGRYGQGSRTVLRLGSVSVGEPFTGTVDAVVVGCLAFEPGVPYLYSFDTDRTAGTLENLLDGSSPDFTLTSCPVYCLASDAQEVHGWPASARGYVSANIAVTATRSILLHKADPATS